MELWKKQAATLRDKFGSRIDEIRMPGESPTDMMTIHAQKEAVIELLQFLRDDPEMTYNFLSDLTATDELPAQPRFFVVYHLLSHSTMARVRIKVAVADGEPVPTAVSLWPAADWGEREVWDMFGIKFKGHPDLRRILMDPRWEGHPLRKDYPLRGYQVFHSPAEIDPELLDMKR
jgi:NADH-quinone oxidoreductase subunit C